MSSHVAADTVVSTPGGVCGCPFCHEAQRLTKAVSTSEILLKLAMMAYGINA